MNTHRQIITGVEKGSIAEELQLEPGDELLSINGQEIEDILDYHFLSEDEYLEILIRKADGEEWLLEVEKDADEALGLVFEESLMDSYRRCRNNCIFCFIDQMPEGMRPSLYFKDDDSRLSFLQGNYVTLTNMDDADLDRIIRYNLSPINISFQAMNPALRCRMLNNRFAGDVFEKAAKLTDAGIQVNGQIVLCKGVNDGSELDYSLKKLEELGDNLASVSVVPVGLTDWRQNLPPLSPFDSEDCRKVVSQIEEWQAHFRTVFGRNLVYASDEWYLAGGLPLPEDEAYDGYVQLENGVGMVRLLSEETKEALRCRKGDDRKGKVTIATGRLAAPALTSLAEQITEKYPGLSVRVIPIENRFFGSRITVAGLITGRDLTGQLQGKDLGDRVLISSSMLKADEDIFLDDMTLSEAEELLNTPLYAVDSEGEAFVNAVIGNFTDYNRSRRQTYEQTGDSSCWKA